ncbi:RING-H2 finger protein [Phytophthora nicotianae]|uniref:RING-H2 finger protein n=1 Tax=Phytophthora nicotianae TaxID=4792 RepID=A0A0W8CRV9_PHYNI|nr:RING-H2 finger protein [Phytophthora nicotianae]
MPVTLLFVHGGGFCKNCWDPIVRRLKTAPLLAGAEFVTFDFKWHGENYDHSVAAQVDRSNPDKPEWIIQPETSRRGRRSKFGSRGQSDKTPLIGVGHSMGAMALWKTEVTHPGTFASLSLFEPGYGVRTPENDYTVDFLVALTLQREAKWPSRAAAEEHFYNLKNFARWDREALAGYLRGGLIDQADGSVILACHPLIEASLYCHTPMHLNDELQQRPRCRITFHGGGRSKIHNAKTFGEMAKKYPSIYRTGPLMPGLSHALVMEDPAQCTHAVVKDLEELYPTGPTQPQSRM